jgi:chromosome segregation ATPase
METSFTNDNDSIDRLQLDLWAEQLLIRQKYVIFFAFTRIQNFKPQMKSCRDINHRLRLSNFDTIVPRYIDLVEKLKDVSQKSKDLKDQALEVQRTANGLQQKRIKLLMHHLGVFSTKLSTIYKRIVPGADCYLNYATNPISLFQEGVTLVAQHGQSSWREVCYYH